MEVAKPGFAALERSSQRDEITESALGLVSTQSFPAIIQVADKLLKSAGVILIGFEKIGGGHCTAIVRGRFADIRMAVEAGRQTAEEFDQIVSTVVIPRPLPNLEAVLPIGSRVYELARANHDKRTSNQAIGLIETRGFPAMVGAADAMLKAAEVQLASYEKIGAGLCTAIIRGAVADVLVALEVGVQEAERIGELNAVTVIPRPSEDLEQSLPVASCLLEEQPQPLLLPLTIKEPEAELVKLPNLATLPAQIKNES
jgi:carbon dioxide concentrating mechanism protein CcmO